MSQYSKSIVICNTCTLCVEWLFMTRTLGLKRQAVSIVLWETSLGENYRLVCHVCGANEVQMQSFRHLRVR